MTLSISFPGVVGFYTMITNLCRQCNPSGWELWRLPGRIRAYILGVHVAALTVLGIVAAGTRWRARDAAVFAALVCCIAVTIEVTRRVGVVYGAVTRDVQAVWYICAIALCPLFYVLLLPMIQAPYRVARTTRGVKYRQMFSGSACALAYGGAALIFHALPHSLGSKDGPQIIVWLAVLTACGAFGLAANNALIMVALRLNDPSYSIRKQAIDKEGAVSDSCQLSLAVLISLPAAFSPYLLVAAIPIVVVMRRFMMHAQLVTAARVDPKTGLLNATTWQREAELEVARAERTHTPLAIAIADIDHFKLVNDKHGHLVGDAALSLISATMSALLRDYDLLGRFGGEEFAICLPHTDPEEAHQVADRLRQKISMISTQAPGAPAVQITISVGVASLESAHRTLDELIAAADAALYRAKAAGRNCVILSREERLRSTG
jgi:diguanylate cyclase (GGDEF)-like protein